MIEFDINGTKRGFFFGTYTFTIISELTGLASVNEILSEIKNQNIVFITKFLFACAKHYAKVKGQPVDFDEMSVCDWLDELGYDQSKTIFEKLIANYREKNMKAPTVTGQPT